MTTSSIYIFEAGSTKTDVLIYKNKTKLRISLSGFNPNREDTNFTEELSKLHVPKDAVIYFYGSGLSDEFNKQKVANLFQSKNISVSSDTLGASRALFKKKRGIACILGTGGHVVYYDGEKIIDKHGGYGYLIDDYGGGLELGKIIISKWLNNSLTDNSSSEIETYLSVSKNEFISKFYRNKDLHLLSGVCQIIPKLALKDKNLSLTIQKYFDDFTGRHIYPMCHKYNLFKINIVGSIGLHFNHWIHKSCAASGIIIEKSITKPIDELLEFHLSQK